MAMEIVAVRMDPALRREMRRLIRLECDAGRELTESALIRTAVRQYVQRETRGLESDGDTPAEGREHD